ncbi:MAG: fused MFS/spermidine synthase [Desertimonas sp.]
MPRWLSGTLVFVSSGSVLVLEILAGRVLAPFVGVSLNTFTGIIGVILAGIAAGAWLGGRLADRHDPRRLLPGALVLGGASAIAAVPLVRLFGSADVRPGPSAIVFLAAVGFFLPSMLLSAVTPLVVKIELADPAHTGQVVGTLSALGTAGSLLGVFATGYVLVAAFPTTPVVVALGSLLVGGGVALWLATGRTLRPAVVAAGVLVAGFASLGAVAIDDRCDIETAYFCARVRLDTMREHGRILQLDTLEHSYVDIVDPTFLGHSYANTLADVLAVMTPAPEPIDVVHVGGGGFTMPRYLAATRPGTHSTVLELDEAIVELGEAELGLELGPDLVAVTGDARTNARAVPRDSADVVIGDAFGGRSVPWHLTTVEFVRDIDRILRPDGLYVLNVIDRNSLGFARAELQTLRDVFPHVAVVASEPTLAFAGGGNLILVGSHRPIDAAAITDANRARGDGRVARADDAWLDDWLGDADVLTDEHAPVDQLISG